MNKFPKEARLHCWPGRHRETWRQGMSGSYSHDVSFYIVQGSAVSATLLRLFYSMSAESIVRVSLARLQDRYPSYTASHWFG